MMKQQEKNYYIQQKLPKVSMQLLEKKKKKLMKKKRLRTMMNMKMYRKYNETVLTVNSDVLIFSL